MMGGVSVFGASDGALSTNLGASNFGAPQIFGTGPMTASQADFELERKLFVSNIPFGTSLDQFCQEMRYAGPVQRISLEASNTQSVGYGFVTFRDVAGVDLALEIFSKRSFNGAILNLERTCESSEPGLAETKPARSPLRGSRASRGKHRSPHKNSGAPNSEVHISINDLIRQGPPPPIHGRRFPLPPSTPHVQCEKSKTTIFVGNLGQDIDEERFAALFSHIFPVRTWLVRRLGHDTFKGFGFVELRSMEEQKRLLSSKASFYYQGQQLIIKPAVLPTKHDKDDNIPLSGTESSAWPPLSTLASPQITKKTSGFFPTPVGTSSKTGSE